MWVACVQTQYSTQVDVGHILSATRRAWSSSAKSAASTGSGNAASSSAAAPTVAASTRAATPGTLRVSKGFGADKHEAELDSTLARIIGSDWGDRSHQPVSLAMRLYWVVFALVLANGVFTYVTGKDESFLVEKLKKKADEKLGVEEEENEFEEMAQGHGEKVQPLEEKQAAAPAAPASMPSSPAAVLPFAAPGIASPPGARRPRSKEELQQQLAQLRLQQTRLQKQISSGEGVMKEELEHQVRMIDVQKDEVKRLIKSM
ncbi:unnamed protein product [Phytophthora fragariaefolia]|uniref:Unnamed protein product n=1 Tax=Phytophthora fragariaefolia TaxID=1490495 RepID=A0A9W6XL45_9STRA|nr:unnamed protein product [Phytophthora fragariaefolia]